VVILKFGGSSVATLAAIDRVAAIVGRVQRPACVVVSALAGVTDQLVEAARLAQHGQTAPAVAHIGLIAARHAAMASAVCRPDARLGLVSGLDQIWHDAIVRITGPTAWGHNSPAATDAVVACGERASSRIVEALLSDRGLPAQWVDARQIVITDGHHGHALPIEPAIRERTDRSLRPLIERGAIPILGGFIGATADGETTTLGRGGSDYSASLLGAALGADEIRIWTDVDGMLTADPRIIDDAETVSRLSFAEAAALASFGAKVLHPSTVGPAIAANIPVRILNTFKPGQPGTLITGDVTTRRHALAGLATTRGTVPRHDGLAIVAAVGERLRSDSTLRTAVIRALDGMPLQRIEHAHGDCHLAVALPERHVARAMAMLHARFFDRGLSAAGPAAAPRIADRAQHAERAHVAPTRVQERLA
jgi:aspartate kinase